MTPRMTDLVLEKEQEKKQQKCRPWYKIRRIIGTALGIAGATIVLAPGAPVIFAIGSIGVTTTMFGTAIGLIGTHVFSYGQGAAEGRKNAEEK